MRPTYTVYSAVGGRCIYGREPTVTEAATPCRPLVAPITSCGANYGVGPWELWVASPEDIAGGRIGCEMTRAPFPPAYGPLAEAWLEIASMGSSCRSMAPCAASDDGRRVSSHDRGHGELACATCIR
jgi:hypothetical protein